MVNHRIKTMLSKLQPAIIITLSIFLFAFSSINPCTASQHKLQPAIIITLSIFLFAFSSINPCTASQHPVSTLLSNNNNVSSQTLPQIISSIINHTLSQVKESYLQTTKIAEKFKTNGNVDVMQQRVLHACIELLQLTITHLHTSIISNLSIPSRVHDVQALLSAASTNQHTCLDGVAQSKSETIVDDHFKVSLVNISNQLNNALAMVAKLPAAEKPGISSSSLSSLKYVYPVSEDGHPSWMTDEDRQNIVSENNEYDLVVAKDGSGNFETINEALNAAPNERSTRFLIYIKAGAYFENVVVTSQKKNIMFVGDGYDKTWIKGNRNAADGWPTYASAVLAVEGEGFIGKNIAIENYAGPTKLQAVALRTTADRSAFFRCRITGYQDTLFVHSLRQFFRECEIYGTIDFIVGNSAVVFQKCSLYARRPLSSQYIVFTAQGRTSPDQTTGMSIMESKIEAASDMVPAKNIFKSYLGRPWKEYSRTVIMKSYIGDLVDPAGWVEFERDLGLSTLYCGEYMNRGPGANTHLRVKWPGYKEITNKKEAAFFTPRALIQGADWLSRTGVPYDLGTPIYLKS